MMVVADSGSTKTHWAATGRDGVCRLSTEGVNPLHLSEDALGAELRRVAEWIGSVGAGADAPLDVYFYGAGCGTADAVQRMRRSLTQALPAGARVAVESDLLGACRALCGDAPGWVGILGTGANACRYDGRHVACRPLSLGYLLGDEGSGCYIGKRLLTDYLRRTMPEGLRGSFADCLGMDYGEVMQRLYRRPAPNRFLASLAPFAAAHRDEDYVRQLLTHAFEAFLCHLVGGLDEPPTRLSFVGSIAHVFADELRQVCGAHGVEVATIVKEPLPALVDYHLRHASQRD